VDVLSIMGLLLASIAIILGAILKGAGVHALVSAAAFMIVVVGTDAGHEAGIQSAAVGVPSAT
jgi:chemotaxis protein MotA